MMAVLTTINTSPFNGCVQINTTLNKNLQFGYLARVNAPCHTSHMSTSVRSPKNFVIWNYSICKLVTCQLTSPTYYLPNFSRPVNFLDSGYTIQVQNKFRSMLDRHFDKYYMTCLRMKFYRVWACTLDVGADCTYSTPPHNKRYEMYFKTVTGADPAGIRPIIGAQKVFEM